MTGGEPVRLRPSGHTDREFLVALYASTREAELDAAGWGPAERDTFVRMQFDLQDRHYRAAFPCAQHSIVLARGRAVGRLIVERAPGEIRVVDISLLPDHRGHGIGSALLQEVLAEATRAGVAVRLAVALTNPARRLYERFGFTPTDASASHLFLEWRPRHAASEEPSRRPRRPRS